MSDDYIRREDALKGKKTGTFANGICFVAEPCVTVEYIESLESADVVPVVRCKYCRYYVDPDKCCHPDGMLRSKDSDFCSYGERREE